MDVPGILLAARHHMTAAFDANDIALQCTAQAESCCGFCGSDGRPGRCTRKIKLAAGRLEAGSSCCFHRPALSKEGANLKGHCQLSEGHFQLSQQARKTLANLQTWHQHQVCCLRSAAADAATSCLEPRLMTVRASTTSTLMSSTDPLPHDDAPPAASTTNASGAHSYSSRSLALADAEAGLQKTPPPALRMWCTSGTCRSQRERKGRLHVSNWESKHATAASRRSAKLQQDWRRPEICS